MKKKLKELIENSPYRQVGDYDYLMTISNGIYKGFWGKNGYNNILVLGRDWKTLKWYKITDDVDVLRIENIGRYGLNVEIPTEYGMPCMWFHTPIHIEDMKISTLSGKIINE